MPVDGSQGAKQLRRREFTHAERRETPTKRLDFGAFPPPYKGGWPLFPGLRLILATLLAAAATKKLVDSAEILHGSGLLSNSWLLSIVISIEIFSALVLLLCRTYAAWALAITLFFVFCIASLTAVVTMQDCDCFSKTVSPSSMLTIDVMALVGLGFAKPHRPPKGQAIRQVSIVLLSLIIFAIMAAPAIRYGLKRSSERQIILTATETLYKKWPIVSEKHPTLSVLTKGKWMLVVVRQNCRHCKDFIDEFFENPSRHKEGERTAIFVADGTTWHFALDKVSLQLTDGKTIRFLEEPFVIGPAVFLLADGVVYQAQDGDSATALLNQHLDSP
ncbi:MAG: hypothetical protein JNM43_06880 [Planctomycetaceae bacterium]|nr:hypothetical protein [Planctomycetaceae bacterium]